MNKSSFRILTVCSASLLWSGPAYSLDLWPFGKKEQNTAPPAEELQSQEAAAASMLTEAEASNKPLAVYRKLVDKYPFTRTAGTAQFRIAQSLETGGDLVSAFEEYQNVIDKHKSSPFFAKALDSQFGIAQRARTEKISSLMGIKKKLGVKDTIKMFQQVVDNAPQGKNAASASFEIAKIYEEDGDISSAIDGYREMADQYPRSALAMDAQRKVAALNLGKIESGTRDAGALDESRRAAAELGTVPSRMDEDTLQMNDQISEASAEAAYKIAKFYDKQGKFKAAMIYYNDVLRFPGGPNFTAARDRVNELTTKDPGLLEAKNIKISNKDLALKAKADTKSRPDYLGPPPPVDLAKRMRTSSGSGGVPIAPMDPGLLPTGGGVGPDASLLNPAMPAGDLPPLKDGEMPLDATLPKPKKDNVKSTDLAEPALPSATPGGVNTEESTKVDPPAPTPMPEAPVPTPEATPPLDPTPPAPAENPPAVEKP